MRLLSIPVNQTFMVNHPAMKRIPLLILIFCYNILPAQNGMPEKGKTVFIEAGSSDDAKKIVSYTRDRLSDWGYWKLTNHKKEAGVVLKLEIRTHGGVTWTSWGGKSVEITATMESKDGETLWRSKRYKSSPNGANGFNAAEAAVNKLVKALKNEWGRE